MARYKRPQASTIPLKWQPTSEQKQFMARRVQGFLDNAGQYTLEHLLSEAYRQGLADAVDAMAPNKDTQP